jgi:hypothetical protein
MKTIRIGKFRHYKGKEYQVIGVARHSETREKLVVYKALYEDKEFGKEALWVRPLEMFFEEVEVDGKKVARFEFVGD